MANSEFQAACHVSRAAILANAARKVAKASRSERRCRRCDIRFWPFATDIVLQQNAGSCGKSGSGVTKRKSNEPADSEKLNPREPVEALLAPERLGEAVGHFDRFDQFRILVAELGTSQFRRVMSAVDPIQTSAICVRDLAAETCEY